MESGEYIRHKIEQLGVLKRYSPGEVLFQSDSLPEYLYYIRKGNVLLLDSALEGNGDLLTVSLGNLLGLTEFISGSLYKMSAYSETKSYILQLDREAFEKLFMLDVQFRTEIVRRLSSKFVNQNKVFE